MDTDTIIAALTAQARADKQTIHQLKDALRDVIGLGNILYIAHWNDTVFDNDNHDMRRYKTVTDDANDRFGLGIQTVW